MYYCNLLITRELHTIVKDESLQLRVDSVEALRCLSSPAFNVCAYTRLTCVTVQEDAKQRVPPANSLQYDNDKIIP